MSKQSVASTLTIIFLTYVCALFTYGLIDFSYKENMQSQIGTQYQIAIAKTDHDSK